MQVIIQVSELRFANDEGVLVLEDVSFGVPWNGFTFVVGPPSSGKTLLLRLILREVAPSGGQILLLGRNVARLPQRKVADLRRRVGYVPQSPVVLTRRTVAGNLEFKLRALGYRSEEMKEHAERAVELANLRGKENLLAGELPEVDRRQLALALALCPEPTVLCCDDIFHDLPALAQDELVNKLLGIHRAGIAILATTSDPELPRRHGFQPHGVPFQVVYLRQGVMA